MGYFICVKMRVNRYKHYDSWFFLCTYWTQSANSEQLSLSRAGIVRNMHSTRLKPVHRVSRMESAASLLYFFAIAPTDRSPCTNTENNSCIRSVGVTSTSFALVWQKGGHEMRWWLSPLHCLCNGIHVRCMN